MTLLKLQIISLKFSLIFIAIVTVYVCVKLVYTYFVYEEIEKAIAHYVCDKYFGKALIGFKESIANGNEAVREMLDLEETMIDFDFAVLDLMNWKKESIIPDETYEKIRPYLKKRKRSEKN